MSFRRMIVFGLLLSVTVSCSYFLKEEPEKSNVYNLKLSEKEGVSCVKDNNQLLSDYFDLQRDDQQIATDLRKMKKCLQDAINLFTRHVKGSQQNFYSAQEIHDFLNIAFDGYDFPLDFMQEAFLLKNSLLGGRVDVVSKEEIKQLPIYIDYIYESLAELAPERHFLFSRAKSKDIAGFEKAVSKFEKVLDQFKKLPRKTSGYFDYDGAVRLVKYFLADDVDMDKWDKTFDLVNSLQSLLSVGKLGAVQSQKLPQVISNLSQLYMAHMQFFKFVEDEYVFKDLSTIFTFPGLVMRLVDHPNIFTDEKLQALASTQKRLLGGVRKAAQQAPHGKIPLSYVSDLVLTLSRIGSIPDYIQAETLQEMIPQLFDRWLRFKECGNSSCYVQSLTAENVDVLQKYIDEWNERQTWINQSGLDSGSPKTRKYFVRTLQRMRAQRSSNVDSFLQVLSQVSHVHWEKYVVIGDNKLTYKDLVLFNKLYTLAHLFIRPFNNNSNKASLTDYYLNSQQAQDFYKWLRPLALDLKLGDPRSLNAGKNALIEINLFGSNSTDPDKLNFSEAIEYFEIAISTGLKSVDIMKNHFVECRRKDLPLDIFEYERFDALCYRPLFYQKHEDLVLSSMPKLVQYLNNHSKADRKVYLNYLERAARQGMIVDEPFDTDAFRMMGSISQYAESLFLRFDEDKNDILATEEITAGLKHIVPNIKELIRTSTLTPTEISQLYKAFPDFEENLILFIFKNKQVPGLLTAVDSFSSTAGVAQLKVFKAETYLLPSTLKRLQATREDVLLVISALSGFNRANRIKSFSKFFFENELEFDKGVKDEKDPTVDKLSRLAQCSENVTGPLRQWIVDNQDKFWKDALVVAEIKTSRVKIFGWQVFDGDAKVDKSDTPRLKEDGIFGGWQGSVTKKFVELLLKEPTFSAVCTLPYLEEVHDVSEYQDVYSYEARGKMVIRMQRRDPY